MNQTRLDIFNLNYLHILLCVSPQRTRPERHIAWIKTPQHCLQCRLHRHRCPATRSVNTVLTESRLSCLLHQQCINLRACRRQLSAQYVTSPSHQRDEIVTPIASHRPLAGDNAYNLAMTTPVTRGHVMDVMRRRKLPVYTARVHQVVGCSPGGGSRSRLCDVLAIRR